MKKFYKTLTFIVSLLLMGNVSFSQPGNIHYGISGNWNDVTLTDRGVTMAGSLQSPSDDPMFFLFSSSTTNYNPKWCGSNAPNYYRPKNQMLLGNNNGAYHCPDYCVWGVDMECSVLAGNYYTLIVGKNSTANNDMSILETSYNPIDIVNVTQSPASNVSSSESVTVTVNLSGVKNANEHIYVRYTTDSWVTSSCIEITSFVSNQGTATIPAQAAGTTVSYYALSSIDDTPNAADIDYLTLRINNNNNANYSYKVGEITWCNLQSPPSGTCVTGSTYMVYAQVYAAGLTDAIGEGAGIQSWIGYSTTNTDPSTWTNNWIAATYNGDFGNNDEYQANIGSALPVGTYYYASRFQLGSGPYYYGGYEATTGGFWDGSNYISGAFAVIPAPPTITLQTLSAPAGNVSVNIDITGFSMGISAAQWYIYYDPAVLTYSGTSNWAPGFDNSYFVLEISSGVLFFMPGTSTVPYSGTLCQIDFTGYSGASCTDITWETDPTISNIKWDEALFNDYSVNWVNGQVCPCSATSPVWWTGAVNTDWEIPGNWSCNSVPTSTNDVTIPLVTNFPVISSTPAYCRNLTIQAGASVTVNSGNTLSVYGNWLNIGQSNAGSGTVVLAGTNAQTINGTTTFGNLTLNNGNGANLNGNTEVAGVLTLSQGTLITGGFLTLLSTDTQTALIAGTGSGSVSGNVTMQRYMLNKLGYHYYSSPFTAAAVNEFADEIGTITSGDPYGGTNDTLQTVTPFPNFYAYDETPQYYMQIGWTGAGATMAPMRGYCINFGAAGGDITADVTGIVNNGPLSVPVTKTASPYPTADGWNLVGNPYPSPIDWQAASGWTKTNVSNGIYYFKPSTQYTGSYSTFVGGVGTNGGTGIIPSMQGFFVKATGSGPFSVTNDVRISELNPVFHKSSANTILLRLKGYPATNEPSGDETVIYFEPQASQLFDDNFDAYKWMNNDPAFPNLFTRDNTPNSLAINALPPLANTDVVIPLGFTTKTGGSFTIKATEILNFDPAIHIYLEDNQNSTSQDLTLDPGYTFTINANDPLYRFFIRFSPAIVTGIDQNGSSFVDAWSSGKDIYVSYSNTAMQNAEISVYNMLGQKVISAGKKGSGTARYRVEEPGCYIINVINGSNTYQKKVVIM